MCVWVVKCLLGSVLLTSAVNLLSMLLFQKPSPLQVVGGRTGGLLLRLHLLRLLLLLSFQPITRRRCNFAHNPRYYIFWSRHTYLSCIYTDSHVLLHTLLSSSYRPLPMFCFCVFSKFFLYIALTLNLPLDNFVFFYNPI